ncbi:hypothetical protein LCGC14_0463940 [marine sediment metagenome]|uniref:Uncharacterized protein n=1 Tax=marine sediment metagenome TaxID=412755 RepID=A0A0F9V132_9ZZZZ
MAQFIGKATEYLKFGSVNLFAPPKAEDCGTNQLFCQPTEQGDNITFQFLAAETVNLVADGGFPDGSHNSICGIESWCGQGWSILNNKATHLIGNTQRLKQLSVFTTGNYYRVTVTITDMTAGFILPLHGLNLTNIIENGTYTYHIIWTPVNGDFRFSVGSAFDGAVSNLSVVQIATAADYTVEIFNVETGLTIDTVPPAAITGSTENNVITVDFNWTNDVTVTNGCREIRVFLQGGSVGDPGNILEDTFETNQGWGTFGGVTIPSAVQSMAFVFTGDFINAAFISLLEVGVEYTVTYDVVGYVSGEVTLKVGNTLGTTRNGNGTFTETLICTVNGQLVFLFADVAGVGNLGVDNVIVSKLGNFDGQSECFDLQDAHDCTFLWVWSNENRWRSYDYSVITGGAILTFQHKLRVTCNFRGAKYPSKRNIGEDSAGRKSMDYSDMRKTKLLDIYFAPEYIHDAIAAFFMQDNRTINGKSYIMDDEYEPSAPNDSRVLFKDLMNATIEIEETSQPNQINRNE